MSVHNLKHDEQMKSGDVYIGRGSIATKIPIDGADGCFGNPFPVGPYGWPRNYRTRSEAVAEFETYARDRIANDPAWRERVKALHGKRLFCFCAPLPCHGDLLEQLSAELNGVPA